MKKKSPQKQQPPPQKTLLENLAISEREIQQGHTLTHAQARQKMSRWLKPKKRTTNEYSVHDEVIGYRLGVAPRFGEHHSKPPIDSM